jgi:hypothetical protein
VQAGLRAALLLARGRTEGVALVLPGGKAALVVVDIALGVLMMRLVGG